MKQQQVEPKTYYSRAVGLCISAIKGQLMEIAGEKVREGEKLIQFFPMGQSGFGSFTTADPELIEFLDRRIEEVGDVFGPQKFSELSTPLEIQNLELKRRLIESENRLTQVLREQGKLPKQSAVPA